MGNVFKFKQVVNFEQSNKEKFSLCSKDNNIILMPPILKKVGLFYHLAFPVIELNKNNNLINIKRPIGILLINKKGKEKIFDLDNFEFCKNLDNFDKIYFSIDKNSPFWPNKTIVNEEKFKVLLDLIQNILQSTSLFKKPNENNLKNYLEKLKNLVPVEYWIFYDQLLKNEIVEITDDIKNERFLVKVGYIQKMKQEEKNFAKDKKQLKEKFKNYLKEVLAKFVKKEIVPNLKGKGSYTKLLFYTDLGKLFKQIDNEFDNESCYNPLLDKALLNKNKENEIENYKCKTIKLLAKACENIFQNNNSVDTIGIVLIVFLNAMFVEELNNTILQYCEDEVTECMTIYNEDINKIKNVDAKKFLDKTYNLLCEDYRTANDEDLSDIYYGYTLVHKQKIK